MNDSKIPGSPVATPDKPADQPVDPGRRSLLRGALVTTGAAALLNLVPSAIRSAAWAAGSDAPEKPDLKIGFIPLTDCAPVVMAALKGFDKKYGLNITPTKEASWAAVRDKLMYGEIDAAHVLYGLIYGVQLGTRGPQKDMAVLLTLNNNGQAITLSNDLKKAGVTDGAALKKLVDGKARDYVFAQTFPTGTHAMWLYYWLAANGIDPFRDVKNIVVPPPQMVANMRVGNMDGFCVGEPWNARAIADDIGFTAVTSQEIWPDHPEKVLGTSAEFVAQYPNTARAMTAAILDAARWCDAQENRAEMAEAVAAKSYVNCPVDIIKGRILGEYENGLGKKWTDAKPMRFFRDGEVTYPWLSDGMWFLTQHKRWGLMAGDPDYLAVARKVNRLDVYAQAAAAVGVAVPKDTLRKSTLIDGTVWDGTDPAAYATSFKIRS
ncbi:MAG: ABC transporter substrate-binding protein [Immundisolibacter sp.]|uniref:CmpA/NrtA family ABC transporter substrate-binding protein n=1 Tax=Immundisolibacter sp. TaxID=1934948 RepID=UPI00199D1F92|nr:CmpA/NrtA family ABC transporter substrate-binding protein [Immundisolibacter sp.]MBC7163149.1 ABC transporter substrate-binding protein [Immundisolibacter sp.]